MLHRIKQKIPTTQLSRHLLKIMIGFGLFVLFVVFIELSTKSDNKIRSFNRLDTQNDLIIDKRELKLDFIKKIEKLNQLNTTSTKSTTTSTATTTTPSTSTTTNEKFQFINESDLKKRFENFKFDFEGAQHKPIRIRNNNYFNKLNDPFNFPINNQQTLNRNPTEEELKNLERIVHIDLKGAPPKISYFNSLIPLLKRNGATGVLLEYEDTFPFTGNLAEAKHGNAYSLDDVKHIKKLCKENSLKIMPLVQTYGHLEWVLKLEKFKHLRDNQLYPQVLLS